MHADQNNDKPKLPPKSDKRRLYEMVCELDLLDVFEMTASQFGTLAGATVEQISVNEQGNEIIARQESYGRVSSGQYKVKPATGYSRMDKK